MRLFPAFAAASLVLSSPGLSRADAEAVPLVRHLLSKGRGQPLLDAEQRLPVIVTLPANIEAKSLGLLSIGTGLATARFAPSALEAFAAAHPALGLRASLPRHTLLNRSAEWTRAGLFREQTGGTGKGVVVGIIDTGIDIAHPDFRDATGKTRIAWLMQLGKAKGLHKELEAQFGCVDPAQVGCGIYSREDIDGLLEKQGPIVEVRDLDGHGSHIASIAAGNGGVMLKHKPQYVGMAPEATLIIANPSVQGTGFFDADVLNAARFIFDRADALGLPAVINLSIGSDFGPHDGSSALERGLAELVGDDKPGRAIVAAVGNSGGLYQVGDLGPLGIHTEVNVPEHATVRVPIYASAAKNGFGSVWITFRPEDDVSVGLAQGSEVLVDPVEPGHEAGADGTGVAVSIVNRENREPLNAYTNSAVVAWSGAWEEGTEFAVLLKGRGVAELWAAGRGDVDPTISLGLLFQKAIRQGTVNIPASHPKILAVGCTINRTTWKPLEGPAVELSAFGGVDGVTEDSLCYFSSAGPTPAGFPKPEISAPGGFIAAAMSSNADPRTAPGGIFHGPGCPAEDPNCYVVDDKHAVAAGTSMSSPQVAGAIALLFQRAPNLTQAQVTEVLQAGARYPTGDVSSATQLGPGALDMMGAFEALQREPADTEVSVDKSWFVLSSAYARPDPNWPVWGTIELRREDGTVASGLSGDRLTLRVTGGRVAKALRKVRHGMFRFAVAGEVGSGGGQMRIEVLYDGQPFEPRVLGIGTDVWSSDADVTAGGGGCTCAAGVVPRGGLSGAIGLFVLATGGLLAIGRRGVGKLR